jgi:hypothetical protein
MKRIRKALLFGLLFASLAVPAWAEVDWKVSKTYKTESPPISIASSTDGKSVFVLSKGGKLFIFSSETGKLKDTLTVDSSMDTISVSGLAMAGIDDKIFLSSSASGALQEIEFDFVVNIDISGSPAKGSKDAPVALVVFSDFQ